MKTFIYVIGIVMVLSGCGRKACEPGTSRACECEPGVEGAQLCSTDGVGWWTCVCSPGEGLIEGESLEVRSTCKRVELILSMVQDWVEADPGCPKVGDLNLDPFDAWGKQIVVVCSPDGESTVMSSGLDGRFGSEDDLLPETCEKIDKFGSLAKYEEAMERKTEEDLVLQDQKLKEHEKELERIDQLIESVKSMHDATSASDEKKGRPGRGSGVRGEKSWQHVALSPML